MRGSVLGIGFREEIVGWGIDRTMVGVGRVVWVVVGVSRVRARVPTYVYPCARAHVLLSS